MILSVILKIKVLPVKLNDISSRNVFTLSEDQERKTMQINWRGFIILLDSVFKVLSLKKFTVYSIMLHAQLIKYHTLLKRNIHGKGNKSFQTMLIFFDYQPFFCFLCISAYSTLKDGMIKSVTKSNFFLSKHCFMYVLYSLNQIIASTWLQKTAKTGFIKVKFLKKKFHYHFLEIFVQISKLSTVMVLLCGPVG